MDTFSRFFNCSVNGFTMGIPASTDAPAPRRNMHLAWTHDAKDVIAHIEWGRDEADRELPPRVP
jgi:hypothetical protein